MRRKTVLWILGGVIAFGIVVFLLLLDIPSWQRIDLDRVTSLPQATVVYDKDGESMGSLYAVENRRRVSLSELPAYVPQAFVAAEDQRFYSHRGVDIRRIFGALWQDVKSRSLVQGGSTITQQLIKLTCLSSEKTFSRKAQEIVLALRLERRLSRTRFSRPI